MEIRAAIEALRALPADQESALITILSDSQLLVKSIKLGWARKWQANKWMRNRKDKAENPDLWELLLAEIGKRQVRFEWTRGHVGTKENERCDELARQAAELATLADEVYERSRSTSAATPQLPFTEFEIAYDARGQMVSIRHPHHGQISIPRRELLPLLDSLKQVMKDV